MRGIVVGIVVLGALAVAPVASASPVAISGTPGDDEIRVVTSSPVSGTYYVNGSPTSFTGATNMTIDGHAGNDRLTVDNAGGLLAPPLGVRFNGGDGIDSFSQSNGSSQQGFLERDVDGPGTKTISHVGESNQKVVLDSVDGSLGDGVSESTFTYDGTGAADTVTFGVIGPMTGRCCGQQYLIYNGQSFDPDNKQAFRIDTKGDGGGQDVVTLAGRWPVAPELIIDDGTRRDLVRIEDYQPYGTRDHRLLSNIKVRAKRLQDIGTFFYRLEATGLAADVEELDPMRILVEQVEFDTPGDVRIENGQSVVVGGLWDELGGVRSEHGVVALDILGLLRVAVGESATATSNVTLAAGWLDLQGSASAPQGTVTLRPVNDGWDMDLGRIDDEGFTYSVSDAELDRVAAPKVQLGDPGTTQITVSGPVTAPLPVELVARAFTGSGARLLRAPTITLRDASTAGRRWKIDGLGVQAFPGAAIFLMPEFGSTFVGGPGADQFEVKASPFTPLTVDGGDPSTAPGDRLIYNAEGRTTGGDASPPDGSITSPQRKPVHFRAIETVTLVPGP